MENPLFFRGRVCRLRVLPGPTAVGARPQTPGAWAPTPQTPGPKPRGRAPAQPPHAQYCLARTRLRTSRLCGSVCSGRFTLCDVLPTPPTSSTRVPRREPVLRLCDTQYTRMPRACARARVDETLTSERCGVPSQPLMPRCDAPLAAWRGRFSLSL